MSLKRLSAFRPVNHSWLFIIQNVTSHTSHKPSEQL